MFWSFTFLTQGLSKDQLNIDTLGCFAMLFEQRLGWAELERPLFCDNIRFWESFRASQLWCYLYNISIR